MRRLAVGFVVVLTMAFLHHLTAAAPLAGRATLALGFLVAAGVGLGVWAESIGVPAVTAYILAGFALGPSWMGLIRGDEVGALGFVSDAALAIVALLTGAALRFDRLSLQRRPFFLLLGASALAPAVVVMLAMVALAHWFPPTAHEPFGDLLIVASVIGASAAASSPTLAIATAGAADGFPQFILGLNVGRDVVAALLFVVILIAAPLIASPGSFDPHGAARPLALLLASVALGAAVALGGSRLSRTDRFTPLLPPALAAGTVALLAWILHVDPILTGMVAGACIVLWAGASGGGQERLQGVFDAVREPLFAAAFGLLGAGLDLVDTRELWAWVLLVVVVRGAALYGGGHWGLRRWIPEDLARFGWMGLISQSGLILWLAAAARHAFPEWGVSLQALIVGTVAVNAVLGPFGYRRAATLVESTLRSG